MRATIFSAVVTLSIVAGTALSAASITTGKVQSFDRSDRTFQIAGQQYLLPASMNFKGLADGDDVWLRWDTQQGPARVVRSFSIEEKNSSNR